MKATGGRAAAHRLMKLGVEGEELSDRLEMALDGTNLWTAVFALGVTGNSLALTEAISIEQNAMESLYARELVKKLVASAPAEFRDPLVLIRIFSNCLSHAAADTIYAPTGSRVSLFDRKRRVEVD